MKTPTTVVVDNGAHTIKAGIVGVHDATPRIIPNAIVRSKGDKTTYIGHELEKCRDFSGLHYRLPFEKGYLTDWDAEKAIWDGLFSSAVLGIDTAESTLLITEPYFDLPNLQDVYDQFAFEEYEFQSYYRCTPAALIPYGDLFARPGLPTPECMLVIDSGFSFTHVIPIINGSVVWAAVERIDVGGKLLTNQLKELTSFRQWNMMDETYIMNDIKEACCYISTDFKRDLEICRADPRRNAIVQEYILPDFSTGRRGRIRQPGEAIDDSAQVMYMNNERFTIPEIIFRPGDIGLEQSGIASSVAHCIAHLPEDVRGMLWAHIGIVGGNAKFSGLRERLQAELRSLAPVDCDVNIYISDEPILEAYRSAIAFAKSPEFSANVVTRAEYLEMGSNACRRKFIDWRPVEKEWLKGQAQLKGRGSAKTWDEGLERASSGKKGTKVKGKARVTRR
ncbi:actin-related protein Arp6 [Laetiporus sulphureus 93-53]|uniref:Actin-like protein ARP6 n=1 Tax=Laetiporus sulphureus 93-53 TaxID=1314785 RepID=A0A165FM39_9APHY|nr:actin-related protein Arp6 [Laetiporus sulphureus 93-53]KZT09178.1 actin-related protein Arp6 [Laetiporus sulphureus 93-53]